MPTPFDFPNEVYLALVNDLIPDGPEKEAILADLEDVLGQCELHAVWTPVAETPAVPAKPRPPVTTAALSEKDAQALRDGKNIPGAVFG